MGFSSFLAFEQRSLDAQIKNNRRIVKTTINVCRGTILGRFSARKKTLLKLFVRWAKLLESSCEFFGNFVRTATYVCSGSFWGFFGENSNCLSVVGRWAKVSKFWQKKIGRSAKTLFYVSRGTISGHFFGMKFFLEDEKHSKDCQNYIQRVQRNTLGRFFGMMKLCSSFLVVVERTFSTFGVKILANLSELQPTCAADHFVVFLGRRVIVWAFSVTERKYPNFGRKNLAGLLKLHFTCPEEQFQDLFLGTKNFLEDKKHS